MQGRKNKLARRVKPKEIMGRWPTLIEGLQFSSQEFYVRVEAAIAERKIPDLKIERIDWKEGGPLTARREYLRMTRERLSFDLCAAPFGTGFFVSLWFREKELKFGFLAWLLVFMAVIATICLIIVLNSSIWTLRSWGIHATGSNLTACLSGIIALAVIGVVVIVGPNLDLLLIQTPVVGYLYERYFRKITLYRLDVTTMYLTSVHRAVTQVVDELTKAQGIPPLSELERRPVMRELFLVQNGDGRN
jgi:hypothetical protein